jgi:hypothetical protein
VIKQSLCTCKNAKIFLIANLFTVTNVGSGPHVLVDKHMLFLACWRRHVPIQHGHIPNKINGGFLHVTETTGIVFVD